MLVIIMQLDISTVLTPQVTITICHHMKKNIIKKVKKGKKKERKYKNMGNQTKTYMLTKTMHS